MKTKNISVTIVLQHAYLMGRIAFKSFLPGIRKVTFQFSAIPFGEQFSCFNQLMKKNNNDSKFLQNFKKHSKQNEQIILSLRSH